MKCSVFSSSHLLYHSSTFFCFTPLGSRSLLTSLRTCGLCFDTILKSIIPIIVSSSSCLVYRKAIGLYIFILYHIQQKPLLKNFFMNLILLVRYLLNIPLGQTLWVLPHITIFLSTTTFFFCPFVKHMFLK